MQKTRYSLLVFTAALMSCATAQKTNMKQANQFDLEAHRGGRGLMPENTIPAMKNAIDLGAVTLEMDVVISKDNKVVVSHDPYFNDVITTTPAGASLAKKDAANYLLYSMPYDSIRKFDVGMKPHPDFPRQKKIAVSKPLLADLLDATEAYAKSKGKQIRYNIEIKSKEGFDGVRHPAPPEFAELLLKVLADKKVTARTIVQSFDVRPLQYLHGKHPAVQLSYLVEATAGPFDEHMKKLGFTPPYYSPLYTLVTKESVAAAHAMGMKVVPWTINNLADMKRIKDLGVDGLISDYPDLFKEIQK